MVIDQVEHQREALQREVAELRHEVTRVQELEALLTEQLQRDHDEIAWLRAHLDRLTGRAA